MLAHVDVLSAAELMVPVVLFAVSLQVRHLRDRVALLGAAGVLAVAASPPVHRAAHTSVTGHMVQHLLLLVVAAPLVGLVLSRAPSRLRGRPAVRTVARSAIAPVGAPALAGALHAAVIVAWHHPSLWDPAAANAVLHALEHLTLVATGTWWWASLFHHLARRAVLTPVAAVFAVATTGSLLGVLMMFAPDALYAQGTVTDQQLAGALMAGVMGAVYGVTMLWVLTAAVRRLASPRPGMVVTRSSVLAVLFVAGFLATAGFALPGHGVVAAPPDGDPPADGEHLYRRDCASCHGAQGEGSNRGIALDGVGEASAFYVLSTGRMPISSPGDTIRRRAPAYSSDEIAALTAYVARLGEGPDLAGTSGVTGDLADGGVRYRLHCAGCHGATGIGGAQAYGRAAPSVVHATPEETWAAIVAGPGGMPSFDGTFATSEIAGVVDYVQMLKDPPATGASIPGGRVGEGLVAWLVGGGLLVAMGAWIGRRT